MAGQLDHAATEKGLGDLAVPLTGSDTWTVALRDIPTFPLPRLRNLTVKTMALPSPDLAPSWLPAVLRRGRDLVKPELRAAVATLHPQLALIGGYSFGWCDAEGALTGDQSGKMLRSTVALLSAELVEKPVQAAIPGAIAVELLHSFSLIHDDIMDRDEQRRHHPAVWKAFGPGSAVLAGDALFALAVATVANVPSAAQTAGQLLADTALQLCRGQAQDLAFEQRPWTGSGAVTEAEYRAMASDKTGALISCALAIGAILGGAPGTAVETLARAGQRFGLAFQIVDDVLAGQGDPSLTGKPVLNDLRRNKKSYPILAALSSPRRAGTRLRAVIESADRLADDDLARLGELITEAGGYQRALREAHRQVDESLVTLSRGRFNSQAVDELEDLASFLLGRSM